MTSYQGRGRRHGQNVKDFRASGLRSLHPRARDSKAASQLSPAEKRNDSEEDILAPPDGSDESDSGNSDDLETVAANPAVCAARITKAAYEDDVDKSELPQRPRTQTYIGRKSHSMAKKRSGGFVRPPKRKQGGYKTSDIWPRFQPVPPPAKLTDKASNNGFVDIPPATDRSTPASKSEVKTFVAPPQLPPIPSNTEGDGFVDPVWAQGLHLSASTKSRLIIRDELNEYLDQTSRQKRVKSQMGKEFSAVVQTKKRAISPEAIFMLPLPSSAPSEALLPDHEFLTDHGDHNDDSAVSSLDGSTSSRQEIRSSNTSVCSSQSGKCPMCQSPIDISLMDTFRVRFKIHSENQLTVRQQELLHVRHSRLDAEQMWQDRNYPSMDWQNIHRRFDEHEGHIAAVIGGQVRSYHRSKLRQTIPARGRKTATLAEEMKTGETASRVLGYYGTRGQRIIGDWLLSIFSTRLKRKSREADVKLAGGVGGFTQKVLIPELVQCLICTDLENNLEMKEGATRRANSMITKASDGMQYLHSADNDLSTAVQNAATEAGISDDISELESSEQLRWLARFVALESAECGVRLSEEMADMVPLDPSGDA